MNPSLLTAEQMDKGGPALAGLHYVWEPIAALASAPGAAAVALIRLSGKSCLELLRVFLIDPLEWQPEPRKFYLKKFRDPQHKDRVIDEVLFCYFQGPASFTGEDSIEINCHGSPYIVQKILELLFRHGFRQAEPGEFTKRAFLLGKMDLSAAEGIKELVEAQTEQQWLAARHLATGQFAHVIEDLRLSLIEALAFLAARIDFPDEGDTADVDRLTVRGKVDLAFQKLQKLENSYANGRVASQGLMVTILGCPNMGKSTLLNALLRKDRAIVTAEAGTTRDYLEESCRIRGRLIRLIDTAGVREAEHQIEKVGIERTLALAEKADLILLLLAADAGPEERKQTEYLATLYGRERCLIVLSKADQGSPAWAKDYLPISCRDDQGLQALEKLIADRVDSYVGKLDQEPFVSSARHQAAIASAVRHLEAYYAGDDAGQYDELLAFELQAAARELGGILGNIDVEDILDKVFSSFCVGK